VSAFDINNKALGKVSPLFTRLTDRLIKLPGVESFSHGNRLLRCKQDDGSFKYLKILGSLQDDYNPSENASNLIDGFGAILGDDESVWDHHLADHSKGEGLIPLYIMPDELSDSSMSAFNARCKEALTYDKVILSNPAVKDVLKDFLNKEAFNKFYHIHEEKPKEVHQEVDVTARGKALVRDFWKAQKALKQHEDNPLSFSDIEDLKTFIDSDEGYTAFGKYYNYAKKLIRSWLGESITLKDSIKLLRESGFEVY
jgi:hypothetical protein